MRVAIVPRTEPEELCEYFHQMWVGGRTEVVRRRIVELRRAIFGDRPTTLDVSQLPATKQHVLHVLKAFS